MRIRIIHETGYKFSTDIFLEPHFLRFRPKNTYQNTLESFSLILSPEPAGFSEQYDLENNSSQFCWFDGLHSQLKIRSESTLITRDYNPFNFLVFPQAAAILPFNYPPDQGELLNPYLQYSGITEKLAGYAESVKKSSGSQTISFITGLTEKIHSEFKVELRQEGDPLEPALTFQLRKGSCRDLAWMLIQLFRFMGIASRFVSGYFFIPSDKQDAELHAWVETYVPGVGWFGIDPSHGIVIGNHHIPIAASSHYRNTMPVSGTVRGEARSELASRVSINIVD